MRVTGLSYALLAAGLSQAQYLISDLSFGHAGKISPPEANGQIPNFILQGQPQQPEVLSNRIVLTPVSPGNQRGAVWAQKPLQREQWIADVDFRASGPERGGGNMNIWLVRGGPGDIGSSSIYTVGRFDGLALVIDTHAGSTGMIRGFLNDKSLDYKNHHNVDELAFGHCSYGYRNLGRPSQIKMRQTSTSFKVEVDGQLCFESDKFSIPTGYQFGVTAATPDNPDSFEVFKLVVMEERSDQQNNGANANANQNTGSSNNNNNNDNNNNAGGKPKQNMEQSKFSRASTQQNSNDNQMDGSIPDQDAKFFTSSELQFADLHNRLQSTNHQIGSVYRSISRQNQIEDRRWDELKHLLTEVKAEMAKLEELGELQRRVKDLEKEFRATRNELGRKIKENERFMQGALSTHHETLSETVTKVVPGHGKLIMAIVGTNFFLIGAFIVYKRRKASMPKKYL